jgi:hypothetical protein
MDVGKILHELTYAEGLPKEALKTASAQRVDMVPLFVQEIEHFLALDPGARAKSTPRSSSFSTSSGNGGRRPLIGRWHVC